jgi:hypothetical protein
VPALDLCRGAVLRADAAQDARRKVIERERSARP